MSEESFAYGGQAVIEGVMMRGRDLAAVAVRGPDGEVVIDEHEFSPLAERWPFLSWPFIRGVVSLGESLTLGIHALMFSANESAEEPEEELTATEMMLTTVLSFVIAVAVFVLLPTVAVNLLEPFALSSVTLNLIEGFARIGLLLAYLALIARAEDIHRVLEYHGAEHKAIFTYENGLSLTVKNARRQPRLHPRCGTSFLLFVAVVAILLYSLFGWPGLIERIAVRLLLLPVVAGASYELIRWSSRTRLKPVRWVFVPGLWLQRLTTREPDDEQLQVALAALQRVIERGHQGLQV